MSSRYTDRDRVLRDQDAKVGHKITDTTFFGYKTHIAMTQDLIIYDNLNISFLYVRR